MGDMLLRDTDRSELVSDIVAEVVASLRPVLEKSTEPMLVHGDRMAELLGVSRATLDRLRRDRLVPSLLIGSRRLYQPKAVIEALVANQKGPSHD